MPTSCTLDEMPAMAGLRLCPGCGTNNATEDALPYSQEEWELKACRACSMVYLENPPPVEALVDEYNWTSTFTVEAAKRREARPTLALISNMWKHWRGRWLPRRKLERLIRLYVKSGKLLDIGCSAAALFDRIPDSIIPYGIEIDMQAIAVAKERAIKKGGDVIHADAISGINQFAPQSLDGIVMHSFLEHEAAPLELLQVARRSLKNGGVVIVKVPNLNCWNRRHWRTADWPGFRFPDHVNYFTPQSLRSLVEKSGLKILRFSYWDRIPSSDNMWLVATR
jgi:SAM-dependent methyltransferase